MDMNRGHGELFGAHAVYPRPGVRRQAAWPPAADTDRDRYPPTSREIALEAELTEVKAQLRATDEFLAIAAHELRNPMTPIAARVQLLITQARRHSGHVPSEILSGLERLEYLVDAYLRRATTLLDVSRISTGNLQLTSSKLDISSLVRETVSALIPAAETAGCTIQLAVRDGVARSFDRTALEQIIENIDHKRRYRHRRGRIGS
jgi:signal transduction histidine kinase